MCGWVMACDHPAPGSSMPAPSPAQPPTDAENQPPEELTPVIEAADDEEWDIVRTFTGEDSDTTSLFHISGIKWRIRFAIDAKYSEYAVFNIAVYPEGQHGMLVETVSHSNVGVIDTAYINEGGQDYYLEVIATNLRNWTVMVEEHTTKASVSPVQITHIRYEGTVYPTKPEECICTEKIEPDEYVAVKNLSDSFQDIKGWVLKNVSKGYPTFTFPSYAMTPGETVLVYTDEFHWSPQKLRSQLFDYVQEKYNASCDRGYPCMSIPYPSEPGGFTFYYGPGNIWDNEEPEVAILYNSKGEEASRRSYMVLAGSEILAAE